MIRATKTPRDIDALFERMIHEKGHKSKDRKEWSFHLRGNFENLKAVAGTLTKYRVFLDKAPEDYASRRVKGRLVIKRLKTRPALMACITAALAPRQVKAQAAKFRALAKKYKLAWGGVSCSEP